MVCIINNMPPIERPEKMSIRLSREEAELRNELAHHLGIDHAGVMRMALLKLARSEDISAPQKEKAVPEGTARRKR